MSTTRDYMHAWSRFGGRSDDVSLLKNVLCSQHLRRAKVQFSCHNSLASLAQAPF